MPAHPGRHGGRPLHGTIVSPVQDMDASRSDWTAVSRSGAGSGEGQAVGVGGVLGWCGLQLIEAAGDLGLEVLQPVTGEG